MGYPELESFAYGFSRGELTLNRAIYTAVSNVEFDQPTTEGVVMGTRPWPLARTEGEMSVGEGTVTFSDEAERIRFLDALGVGYRTVIWNLSWILSAQGRPNVKFACQGCRVLGNPISHATGEEALGGDISFSFMTHTINGKPPHLGMPAVLR